MNYEQWLDNGHPQVLLNTPRFLHSSSTASVDVGLRDIILDIWDLTGPGGFCRTLYSCQGFICERGIVRSQPYVMFESGYEQGVFDILEFYGKRVYTLHDAWSVAHPKGVWSTLRFSF